MPAAASRRSGPGDALVIGIGNPLRGDDGVGWTLVEELEEELNQGVRRSHGPPDPASARPRRPLLFTVHQLTPELAEAVAVAGRVLFVDAWLPERTDAPPCLEEVEPAATGPGEFRAVESHRLEPAQLLTLSRSLFAAAPRAWRLLVPAFVFGHGSQLSPSLRAVLPSARLLLHRWLEQGDA